MLDIKKTLKILYESVEISLPFLLFTAFFVSACWRYFKAIRVKFSNALLYINEEHPEMYLIFYPSIIYLIVVYSLVHTKYGRTFADLMVRWYRELYQWSKLFSNIIDGLFILSNHPWFTLAICAFLYTCYAQLRRYKQHLLFYLILFTYIYYFLKPAVVKAYCNQFDKCLVWFNVLYNIVIVFYLNLINNMKIFWNKIRMLFKQTKLHIMQTKLIFRVTRLFFRSIKLFFSLIKLFFLIIKWFIGKLQFHSCMICKIVSIFTIYFMFFFALIYVYFELANFQLTMGQWKFVFYVFRFCSSKGGSLLNNFNYVSYALALCVFLCIWSKWKSRK